MVNETRTSKYFLRLSKLNFERAFVLVLTAVIGALYSPVLGALFNADDFNFLSFLRFDIQHLLNGEHWHEWFIGGIVNYSLFRPMGHLFWLLNYTAFRLDPQGYHIVAVFAHLIVSLAGFIFIYLLTQNRMTAGIGTLLFAIMPVHAEAVSWLAANYDVFGAIYYFLGLIFYVLYRRKSAARFYFVALGAFVLALSSKETMLTLPMLLFVYDWLYHPRDWTRTPRIILGYIPFAIVLAIRFLFFGHGYFGLTLIPEGWEYLVDANLLRVFFPLPEIPDTFRWIALGCAVCLLLAYRFRKTIIFGLVWIPATLIPTAIGGVNDRSFYVPSFGVSLLCAIVLTSCLESKAALAKTLGALGFSLLIILYGAQLGSLNLAYLRASQVARAILRRVEELHPTLSPDARLVFVGVPDNVPEGPPVFGAGLPDAISILYQTRHIRVFKSARFPIWLDDLDHTYFFQVEHRNVTERADLIALLETRKRCSDFSKAARTWDWAELAQDWEAWNQLDGFANDAGVLVARATGNDPFMGSPAIDLAALGIGDIEITMRVRAPQPTFEGEIYWQTSGQPDFLPSHKQSFSGQADGEFHTYRVDIAKSNLLLLGDRITRLRLDPVTMPAEIAIKSIQINTHCQTDRADECACASIAP